MIKSDSVLFTLGIVSLDIPWSTTILGIALTSLGYWKKSRNKTSK
ncbi:MAG: hypothetical protein ACXACB_01215 [Promethearchaeota archaeon]